MNSINTSSTTDVTASKFAQPEQHSRASGETTKNTDPSGSSQVQDGLEPLRLSGSQNSESGGSLGPFGSPPDGNSGSLIDTLASLLTSVTGSLASALSADSSASQQTGIGGASGGADQMSGVGASGTDAQGAGKGAGGDNNNPLTIFPPGWNSNPGVGSGSSSTSTPSMGFSNWSFNVTSTQSEYLNDPNQNPKASDGCSWKANPDITMYPMGIPSPVDVDQHLIGDCGLESLMASWAQQDPAAIQNAIKPTGSTSSDGSPIYNVQMYDPNGKPVTIAVDASSEVKGKSEQAQSTGPDGKPNWSTVLQKAYAKYRDVYGGPNGNVKAGQMKGMDLMGGIDQIDGMEAFTGVKGEWTANSSPSLFSNIGDGLKNHEMIVANSLSDFTLSGNSLPGGHSYTVESVDSGDSTITLRNPWGTGDDSFKSDGQFTMSFDDFKKYFGGVDIGQASVKPSTDSASINKSTLDAFDKNGGGMALDEGADAGKANQALKDEVDAAVKAGDLTSFNAAYDAIQKAMGGSDAGSNQQVIAELETLSANTQWKSDAGSGVIGENIQHAADALAAHDWKSGANPGDIQTFTNDFKNGASVDILKQDAKAIAGDLRDSDLSTNLSAMITQAVNYAGSHANDFGKAPDSSTQQSLIDAFNKAAGAAGAGSFTSNIQDGWKHIKGDMAADNSANLRQDLQWMLDHISDAGNYNGKEQPVVDAINNIAKAWNMTLKQP